MEDTKVWKGFKTNGKLRGYKRDLYEGGIRVPFIASWPGFIPAGHQSDEVIGFQDMLPTFAGLANAAVPVNIDGISVVEALKGNALTENSRVLYWDFGHTRQRYDQAVRIGNWKGIRRGQGQAIEIYDLVGDISEQHNLANAHPELVNKIDRLMETMVIPSPRYPVGEAYKGGPIWKKDW